MVGAPFGAEYAFVAEVIGWFCRRRQVNGACTFMNEVARPDTVAAFSALKSGFLGPSFKHESTESVNEKIFDALDRAKRRWANASIWADDASNFDESTSTSLLEWDDDLTGIQGPALAILKSFRRMPILTGPYKAGFDGYLAHHEHGVLSGTIDTSAKDGRINYAVAADAWVTSQVGVAATDLRSLDATLFVQGDDTCGLGPVPNWDKYMARAKVLGYTRTPSQFPIFLKVWHQQRGLFHTLGS